MGLFKDFKDDFSQAVNEMMPGADAPEKENKAEDLVVNTLGEDVDVKSELSKLDGLLEQVQKDGDCRRFWRMPESHIRYAWQRNTVKS